MKLLMHICCSNCSIFPFENYLLKGIDITGLWFNPNIHPYTEYQYRLESLHRLQRLWNLDIEYADEYDLDAFLKLIIGKGADRCTACYTYRLRRTAETAKQMNADGFTTTLLASPYQKFDMIISIGKELGKQLDIPFYFEDVRYGWSRSRDLSRELGLYRQKYCGCIYSEMERHRNSR